MRTTHCMYVSVRSLADLTAARRFAADRGVGRVVVLLGATSLITDVSSEMVVAVLPLYLTVALGLSPLQFGLIDGLYSGITALVRVGGGFVADRWRRPKLIATIGYALSATCKFALIPVTALSAISAVVAVDRAGKGIRTAPRDAMIAASTRRDALGTAFGVHRSMDTIGAMIGPLVAFALLAAIPGGYDAVLVVSGCVALIGVAVLVLFVPDLRPTRQATEPPPSLRGVGALATGATLRPVLATAGLLALLTVSDGFLYLSLQRREELATELFPLLFVGTSIVYLLLAAPVGRLADRAGRRRVYLAGHLVLVGAYVAALGAVPGPLGVLACLALLGTYYAATDGVLAALTAARLPGSLRASGLALVQTVVAAARFSSALLFGAVWTGLGREVALLVFAGALLAVLPAAAALLRSAGSGPAGRVAGP